MQNNNGSILIVDDQPENLRVAIELLKRMGLHQEVLLAPNGAIAYDLACEHVPELILTDWEMPIMNGLELIKKLKQNTNTAEIPIIMITAVKTGYEDMKEAFEAGVHDYLRKPFNETEFFARIQSTLKLYDSFRKIKEQKNSLEQLNTQLQSKNKELDQFSYVLSHDLKAPLRGISNVVSFIEEDHQEGMNPDLLEFFGNIKERASRMDALIDGVLTYSKAGKEESSISSFPLKGLIDEILETIAAPSGFVFHIPNELPEITCNRIKLSQIITNLFSNAVKHHQSDSGNIYLNVEFLEEDGFRFAIKDDGPGVPSHLLEKIFHIFETGNGQRRVDSSGIGLAIVKKLVGQLGGNIALESTHGEGSTFIFNIPNHTNV